MTNQSGAADEVTAARELVRGFAATLQSAPTFQSLDEPTRRSLLDDLRTIRKSLETNRTPNTGTAALSLAQALPMPAWRRAPIGSAPALAPVVGVPATPASGTEASPPPRSATAEMAGRVGRLIDEVNFTGFVGGLVTSTFQALVDASIRQMEEFADLVRTLARDVDEFTRDNVTLNQARDYLADHHPAELVREPPATPDGDFRLRVRGGGGEGVSPSWMADYGLAGQDLDDELVESVVVPAARRVYGEQRMQLLATMVLLGMNRVVVRDGRITAKVRFRAAAHDQSQVAVSLDPGNGSSWGERGSALQMGSQMFVSTVGVNVQSDIDLKADLFGQVEINFVSETLPLDRFVEPARLAILQRNSKTPAAQGRGQGVPETTGSARPSSDAAPAPAPIAGARPALGPPSADNGAPGAPTSEGETP